MDQAEPKDEGPKGLRVRFGFTVYILSLAVIAAIGLLLNATVVYAMYTALSLLLPAALDIPQLWQFVIYVGPVILLFLEWSVWDSFTVGVRSQS